MRKGRSATRASATATARPHNCEGPGYPGPSASFGERTSDLELEADAPEGPAEVAALDQQAHVLAEPPGHAVVARHGHGERAPVVVARAERDVELDGRDCQTEVQACQGSDSETEPAGPDVECTARHHAPVEREGAQAELPDHVLRGH